jgi:hypothetical protein
MGFDRFPRPTWDEVAQVTALLIAAVGFIFQGPIVGACFLALAVGLMVVLWTPARSWLRIPPHPLRRPSTISDAHREQLQALAGAYRQSVGYRRPACGKQDPRLEKSFWDHFPAIGAALERWDGTLARYERLRSTLWAWLGQESDGTLVAVDIVLGGAVETGADLVWSVNSGALWLGGGWGVAAIKDDTDVAALKAPYEELLRRAKAAPEGRALRVASNHLRETQTAVLSELDGVRLLHTIHGDCNLCR